MLAPLVPPTIDPAVVHPALVDHQADMVRRCPYLGPSVQRGLTVWSALVHEWPPRSGVAS